MRKMRITALVLALLFVLPLAASCGSAQSGVPNSFSDVSIITTYDPNAEPATGEEEPEEYEETIFSGEVVVYTEEEGAEITVLDILKAYEDAHNVAVVYDENSNRVTKIGEISAGGGYFWNYIINGKEAGLSSVVKADDEIQIIFMK